MECFSITNPASTVLDYSEGSIGQVVSFGPTNNFPNEVSDILDTCPLLSSLVQSSASLSSSITSDPSLFFQIYLSLFSIGTAYIYLPTFKVLDWRRCRVDDSFSNVFYSNTNSPYFKSRKSYPIYSPLLPSDTPQVLVLSYLRRPGYHYALPFWNSALKAASVLSSISEYFSNALENDFQPSAVLSFNNGIPSKEERDLIEKRLNDKFSGSHNSRKLLVTFSPDKEHQPTLNAFSSEDISSRFSSLKDSCESDIFTIFACTPSIIGRTAKASNALSDIEYQKQANLFYLFTLKPMMEFVSTSLSKFNFDIPTHNPFRSEFFQDSIQDSNE